MRRSVRRILAITFATLMLTVSATVIGTVAASADTLKSSCASAGGANGVTLSACIEVSTPSNLIRGTAIITSRYHIVISVLKVTQICNSSGNNCSNVGKTYFYQPDDRLDIGTVTELGILIPNSFGHKYRGCVIWRSLDNKFGGGACSPARSI
jgi:hypothetical protein